MADSSLRAAAAVRSRFSAIRKASASGVGRNRGVSIAFRKFGSNLPRAGG